MKNRYNKKNTVSIFSKTAKEDLTYLNQPQGEFVGGRLVSFPASPLDKFCSNQVKTSKYSLLTWAPKSLLWQFQRISNIYFLIMSVLSGMPFSPKSPFSMAGTFAAVLFFTMLKEGYEDYYRHKQDRAVNSVMTQRFNRETLVFDQVKTEELKVGDLVLVKNEEFFPADLVLISSTDPKGKAYVNTVNLDGESNLKEKNSVQDTKDLINRKSELNGLRLYVECDQPSASFEWNCNFQLFDKEKVPLSLRHLMLKGCFLKNTEMVYGFVVYTGHDTKIIQNSKKPPNKVSNVLRTMNKILYTVFAFQIAICITFSALSAQNKDKMEKHSYIDFGSTNEATGYITQFLTFWVAYSHLIPISLYVALEVLKLFLAFLINEDKDLFHEGNMAKCKSSDLIEELGQIEFVFSDKTGTLTRNEMIFRKCMVNGIIYGKSTSDFGTEASLEYQVMRLVRNKEHPYLLSFCRFMALCNSVFPVSSNDEIKYQGSSPDELALITGASNLGVKLIDKVDNMTFLKVLGTSETWETIIEVPFTSDRKRMSVVVRDPQSHKLILMTKGADSVILPLLNEKIAAQVSLEVSAFANEGLRSLVMASRQLPGNEFHDWHEKWKKASLSNDPSKDSQLSQLASDLEHDLEFIGCSGIEDRLQEGVPSTIESLMSAGIRVWVLTGDKEETAVEIGKSCNLIRRNMELLQLSSSSVSELTSKLNLQSEKYSLEILSFRDLELAKATLPFEICIVINGQTLAWALSDLQLKKTFFKLGFLALSCICCRVSPAQKAEVVKLAKTYGKWITLAIGDGANDVSMIQEAHIGIGISGKEGAQASQSADFVFDQFRFLNKFLLVHGRWGYKRVSWFICYYFYKNIAVVFTEIWFALYNGFSGQIFFMDWLPLLYNSFWTSWPCLIAYALEQDIDSFESLRLPELYRIGQKQSYFNFRNFWKWVIFAVWHGSVSYWISTLTTSVSVDPAGGMKSLFWVSTLSFSVIINIVTLKLFLENLHWTWMSLVAGVASLVIYYLSIFGLNSRVIATIFQNEARGIVWDMLECQFALIVIIIVPLIALIPDYFFVCFSQIFTPGILTKCRNYLYNQVEEEEHEEKSKL